MEFVLLILALAFCEPRPGELHNNEPKGPEPFSEGIFHRWFIKPTCEWLKYAKIADPNKSLLDPKNFPKFPLFINYEASTDASGSGRNKKQEVFMEFSPHHHLNQWFWIMPKSEWTNDSRCIRVRA